MDFCLSWCEAVNTGSKNHKRCLYTFIEKTILKPFVWRKEFKAECGFWTKSRTKLHDIAV